ncbi:FxsB family cyclophane-forming radical SAM/SPASM peptide maturase [Streptomyces europaeiscabiei]|uniref:FxsB family cyclophane-forming radical SAM/SPASM peptide maturase n=1 Tax=Streptomyces europaeiscabiei TaxID=146819 RepID=UPI0029C058F3|nr:FxsB family cyclophane-forming radical SAM/SPASM peptide maturase [Streptomyces europaeiscabiei]
MNRSHSDDVRPLSRPLEWPLSINVSALVAEGWHPTPFREFVLKLHSRCDLACDYCYMYEMADQSWRDRPRFMTHEIIDAISLRIADHVGAHALSSIAVVLHGGEPLLAGPELIAYATHSIRERVDQSTRVDFSIQTNAVRLDNSFLRLFARLGVGVGVSLDGDQAAHDRHRRTPAGRGSHAAVTSALQNLSEPTYRHLFRGLLCVVDLRNDPLVTYRELLRFDPPVIDFLLPHGTWASPPPGRAGDPGGSPYADWLIPIFDLWYSTPGQTTWVRLFGEIICLILGGESCHEAFGLSPSHTIVIETDGSIEQSDMLKVAFHDASHLGLHVLRDAFDAALHLPTTVAQQIGREALADACLRCPVHPVCGAGLYAHRYRQGSGFLNPSVYCPDLFRLITHIRDTVTTDLGVQKAG